MDMRSRRQIPSPRSIAALLLVSGAALLFAAGAAAEPGHAKRDVASPTAPKTVTVARVRPSSVLVTWAASRDNVGVRTYGVLRNGVRVAWSTRRRFTFSSLTCGRRYTFG